MLINFYARWLGAAQPALRHSLVPNARNRLVEQGTTYNVNAKTLSGQEQVIDAYGVSACNNMEVNQRHNSAAAGFMAL